MISSLKRNARLRMKQSSTCNSDTWSKQLSVRLRSNGGVFFVQAAAGCGKTFASLLLIGGRTVHTQFKVPLVLTDISCTIKKGSPEAALCREAALIIWDEAPMQEHLISSSVDKTLQDIRENTEQFGGVVTVLLGNWR